MNVLHIKTTMGIGGAETMVTDVLNVQVDYAEVTLLIIYEDFSKELVERIDKRVNVLTLNGKSYSRSPILFMKLNYILWRLQPDVVHIHEVYILKRLLPFIVNKMVATIHNVNLYTPFWFRLNHIFAISQTVYNDILSHGYKNTSLVYNGIDCNLIYKKQNYKKNGELISMVCIGRFIAPQKGQHLLIEALNILINGRKMKNIHLTLIGYGKSEDYYRSLISQYNLNDYISIEKHERSYIYENLRFFDLAIQPSIFEGFGLTVVEAMAAGVPVLVSNIDGPMEIIDNGSYGYFFKSQDVNSLAEKLYEIISDYSTYCNIAHTAMIHVKEHFSVETTAKAYLREYK